MATNDLSNSARENSTSVCVFSSHESAEVASAETNKQQTKQQTSSSVSAAPVVVMEAIEIEGAMTIVVAESQNCSSDVVAEEQKKEPSRSVDDSISFLDKEKMQENVNIEESAHVALNRFTGSRNIRIGVGH